MTAVNPVIQACQATAVETDEMDPMDIMEYQASLVLLVRYLGEVGTLVYPAIQAILAHRALAELTVTAERQAILEH